MKPMGMREGEVGLLEYLEDIIGSNQYINRIVEIEDSLTFRNDERIDKINRVKAAQAELDSMEDQKNIAV